MPCQAGHHQAHNDSTLTGPRKSRWGLKLIQLHAHMRVCATQCSFLLHSFNQSHPEGGACSGAVARQGCPCLLCLSTASIRPFNTLVAKVNIQLFEQTSLVCLPDDGPFMTGQASSVIIKEQSKPELQKFSLHEFRASNVLSCTITKLAHFCNTKLLVPPHFRNTRP